MQQSFNHAPEEIAAFGCFSMYNKTDDFWRGERRYTLPDGDCLKPLVQTVTVLGQSPLGRGQMSWPYPDARRFTQV